MSSEPLIIANEEVDDEHVAHVEKVTQEKIAEGNKAANYNVEWYKRALIRKAMMEGKGDQLFQDMDTNHDGIVSQDEFMDYVDAQRQLVKDSVHQTVTMKEAGNPHRPAQFALLMIVLFFTVGVVYYMRVAGMTFLDAIYFCVVTITTVGYGDLNTTYNFNASESSLIFTALFVFLGIAIVGTAIGIVVGWMMDQEEALLAQRLADGEEDSQDTHWLHMHLSEEMSSLLLGFLKIIVLIAIGTAAFAEIEGHNDWTEAFYWCCVTITTCGYGDVVPTTDGGKVFAIFYILIGCVLMANTISDVADLPLAARRKRMEVPFWLLVGSCAASHGVSAGKSAHTVRGRSGRGGVV